MDLLDILKQSLSHEERLRKEAESNLLNCANENFRSLLITLSNILHDQNIETSIRQVGCILMKNLISSMKEYKGKWSQLDLEIRNQIKGKIIANLSNSNNSIKGVSAITLAGK
jgi:hypothetical protein